MNYRRANMLALFLCVLGVVMAIVLYSIQNFTTWFIVLTGAAGLCIVAGVVVKLVFNRCPHCSGRLPLKAVSALDFSVLR
jgi:hypothetical protein